MPGGGGSSGIVCVCSTYAVAPVSEQSLDARRRLARLDSLPVLLDEPRHVAQARLDVPETLGARPIPLVALGRDEDARRAHGVPLAQPAALLGVKRAKSAVAQRSLPCDGGLAPRPGVDLGDERAPPGVDLARRRRHFARF